MSHASYPSTRLRRNRKYPWLREMLAETRLAPQDFIWPVFVQEGSNERAPIAKMPGVFRLSIDLLVAQARHAQSLGIPAIAIFPVTPQDRKTPEAEEAFNRDNLVCRAVKAVKDAVPDIGIICDVALDPFTSHGHDGVVRNGDVANDETIAVLCKQAVVQARSGCDIIAPSDMMDGRVGQIRAALDAEGFDHVAIMAYAAKYASAFYGPFRDAVGSAVNLGKSGKRTYQMDPANRTEALREVALDISEGTDIVMVKPALAYLDIIREVKDAFPVPITAYQVSGEYAMLKLAGEAGVLDFNAVMTESLLACKRAGANAILTYSALEIAEQL
ncbi:MAG TPA: porphobilinogen synthase [Rickettsiales bacterium]|nr:porphobilinogen synthase [Rickettsiales bacterium]